VTVTDDDGAVSLGRNQFIRRYSGGSRSRPGSSTNCGSLANDPDGQTSDGNDYLDLTGATNDGSLDPGESVMVRLYFANPFRRRFTFELGVWGVLS
jgi:hypothetical protein